MAEQIPEHCDLCAERLDVVGTRWRQAMLAPDNEQEPIRAHAHAVCLAMAAASPSAPDTYEGFLEVLCTTWTGRRWPPGVKPVRADEPLVELLRRQRYTATESMCCEVAVHQRAERCPCWVPVYSGKQAPPRPGLCDTRAERCADCACRPDSPEAQSYRDGVDRGMASSLDGVFDLAQRATPFFCHEGMRRIRGWYHPRSGRWLPQDSAHDYAPPMVGGVPFRRDGRPALVCAGWDSIRRALDARRHTADATATAQGEAHE